MEKLTPERISYRAEYGTYGWTTFQVQAAIQAAEEVGYEVNIGTTERNGKTLILTGNGVDNITFLRRFLELSNPDNEAS